VVTLGTVAFFLRGLRLLHLARYISDNEDPRCTITSILHYDFRFESEISTQTAERFRNDTERRRVREDSFGNVVV